jgi:hypothetical protein
MTPRRSNLSDDEKAAIMCLLIPLLWPLGLAIIIEKVSEKLSGTIKSYVRAIKRRICAQSDDLSKEKVAAIQKKADEHLAKEEWSTVSGRVPSRQPMRYAVLDEFGQVIAMTLTRWTAERLIDGIKRDPSLTAKLGSWSIEPIGLATSDIAVGGTVQWL